jgi:hypothetical protein
MIFCSIEVICTINRTNDSSRTPLHRTVSLDSDRQEDGSKAPFRTPSPNISSSNGSKQKFASPRRLHYSSSFHVNPYSDQQPNYSQSYIERPDLSRNLDSPKTPGSYAIHKTNQQSNRKQNSRIIELF